ASLDRKLAAVRAAGPADRAEGHEACLDIAVIRLPRISNFTDVDPLFHEPDVRVRFIDSENDFGWPDAVILPGSKNTVDDLLYLRAAGLEGKLQAYAAQGGWLTGICAGYQMMGVRLLDPELVESDQPELGGLKLIPDQTVFARD